MERPGPRGAQAIATGVVVYWVSVELNGVGLGNVRVAFFVLARCERWPGVGVGVLLL